jgi:hypothetical protein
VGFNIFESMNKEELKNYTQFILWHYRVVDSFWFISVSKMFDQATAERINENVWGRISGMAAGKIIELFDIKEKGLKGFVQALKYFPWYILSGFDIEENERSILITVTSCPPQEARLRRGLREYVCKTMHKRAFENFAKAIDPHIQVECIFAPPDPHPEGIFCKWCIKLEVPQ